MVHSTSCQQCGAIIASDSVDGLCGRCLATVAFTPASPEEMERESAAQTLASLNKTIVLDTAALLAESEPASRFGDYELISEIARGGMGVVYKARQLSLNRIVAVKMILHARFNNPEFVRRFRAEAEAAGNLRHPNIVGIYEIGEEDDQQYFSMEYVEGRDLASLVRDQPLPPQRAAQHVKAIAEATHYAHQHGILHRDLKPSNVLVDLNGEVRITDFGLAKRVAGTEASSLGSGLGSSGLGDASEFDITASGQVLGSPNYMSPEQAAGRSRQVDARTDVYSLGAILFTLLTGRPPFMADNLEAMLTQVLQVEAPSLRLLNPTVPRDLETVALKCLQKDPARRYDSAQEVAEELGRFLLGESIHARPVSAPEKVWRWCKRKPVVAALGAATALLLVAIAIGSPVAIYRVDRARQEAETNLQLARQTGYATEMLFAAEEIQTDNRGQAMELLNSTRPQPGQPDLRGWEWRFLWGQCHSDEPFTVGMHEKEIYRVAFLPDGRLACGDFDKTIKIWDPKTKTALASDTKTWKETTSLKGHLSLVDSVAVSPDGRWLASGSKDRSVRIWDLKANAAAGSRNLPDVSRGSSVSPKAEFLAVVNGDATISLWDLIGRHETARFPVETGTTVSATSPNGMAVVLRNAESGKVWMRRIDATNSDIQVAGVIAHNSRGAFSPDGKQFAVGGSQQLLRLGATDGSMPVRVLKHPIDAPHEILFSHDGRQIFAATESGKIRVYDAATGEIAWELAAHNRTINGIALDPAGVRLATSSLDETVGLWDLTTRRKLGSYGKSSLGYRCVTFSRDGKRIAASAGEHLVQVWDVVSKREVARFKKTERIGAVRFAADDRTLVIATDNQLSLFRAPTFAEISAVETAVFKNP